MMAWRLRSKPASAARTATVLPAPLAGDHADAAFGDAPADAGEGFVVRAVAVQHAGGQIAPERHPRETEVRDQVVHHRGGTSSPVSRSSWPEIWPVLPDRAA